MYGYNKNNMTINNFIIIEYLVLKIIENKKTMNKK